MSLGTPDRRRACRSSPNAGPTSAKTKGKVRQEQAKAKQKAKVCKIECGHQRRRGKRRRATCKRSLQAKVKASKTCSQEQERPLLVVVVVVVIFVVVFVFVFELGIGIGLVKKFPLMLIYSRLCFLVILLLSFVVYVLDTEHDSLSNSEFHSCSLNNEKYFTSWPSHELMALKD